MSRTSGRMLSLLLTVVLLFSLCSVPTLAADEPGSGGQPGGSPSGGGQEFGNYSEIVENAAIIITDSTVYTNEIDGFEPFSTGFSGEAELAAGGVLTASGASGLKINGGELSNGIAVELGSAGDTFKIGGSETYYEVDGKNYNSVITVDSGTGNETAGYEAKYGVGIAINQGELWIENSYIKSESSRSTPVYAFAGYSSGADTSVVVVDSHLEAHSDVIWMPSFKLLYGGARATLLMSENNSWFYGSEIVANTWGAISQDSIDAKTYVINSVAKVTEGGYGAYLTWHMYFYGSEMYAAQYGIFMCGTSYVLTDTAAAGAEDADMMSKVPNYDIDEMAASIVAAPVNAVVVHTSLPSNNQIAEGDFNNSVLSTRVEDLPDGVEALSYRDDFFLPGVNPNGEPCGQAYFYNKNLYGSVVLIRSMNANFTFDNTEMRSSNGVLLQSVITYDPPSASGYLATGGANGNTGIYATFKNGDYEGDILHEDYQRQMTVTLGENSTLEGAVVSGTMAAWNDKWSEENLKAALAEDEISESVLSAANPNWASDVLSELKQNDTYDGADNCMGVNMVIESGASWTVSETSSLASLRLEEGAALQAPAGYVLTIYDGCGTDSDRLFYDYCEGSVVSSPTAGEQYEGVVIVVTAEKEDVEVTSIKIDGPSIVTLRKSKTLQLNITATPSDAAPAIVWTTSNSAIATVDENGLVKGISTGTVIVTASTENGMMSSYITIRVTL